MRLRCTLCLVVLVAGLMVPRWVHAGAQEVDPPVRFVGAVRDQGVVRGEIVAFDVSGFVLLAEQGEDQVRREIAWRRLAPGRVFGVHRQLLAGDDGARWLEVAQLLRTMEDGRKVSDAALEIAVRIDPSLEERARSIRDQSAADPAAGHAGAGGAEDEPPEQQAPGHGISGEPSPMARFWGPLPEEVMEASIAELKAFAAKTQETMRVRLALAETDHFLFYSDLDRKEAEFWGRQLEGMYARLCRTFDLDKEKNIFRGKCLIFVFRREEDYHRFELTMHGTNAVGSAGMCHSFSNGYAHVAFYRQPDKWNFARLLVHESTHAFVHRYRSATFVPSWINEGLAETVAEMLVPQATDGDHAIRAAREQMARRGDTGGMFQAQHIEPWQYGTARMLTEFMVKQDSRRYAAFFDGVKDGLPWEQSLNEHYGLSLEKLVAAMGKSVGMPGLRP